MSTAIRDEDEWDDDEWNVKWDGPVVVPPSPLSYTVLLALWTVLWLLLVYYAFRVVLRG